MSIDTDVGIDWKKCTKIVIFGLLVIVIAINFSSRYAHAASTVAVTENSVYKITGEIVNDISRYIVDIEKTGNDVQGEAKNLTIFNQKIPFYSSPWRDFYVWNSTNDVYSSDPLSTKADVQLIEQGPNRIHIHAENSSSGLGPVSDCWTDACWNISVDIYAYPQYYIQIRKVWGNFSKIQMSVGGPAWEVPYQIAKLDGSPAFGAVAWYFTNGTYYNSSATRGTTIKHNDYMQYVSFLFNETGHNKTYALIPMYSELSSNPQSSWSINDNPTYYVVSFGFNGGQNPNPYTFGYGFLFAESGNRSVANNETVWNEGFRYQWFDIYYPASVTAITGTYDKRDNITGTYNFTASNNVVNFNFSLGSYNRSHPVFHIRELKNVIAMKDHIYFKNYTKTNPFWEKWTNFTHFVIQEGNSSYFGYDYILLMPNYTFDTTGDDVYEFWISNSSDPAGAGYCDIYIENSTTTYVISQNNTVYCLSENIGRGGANGINFTNGVQNTTLDCLGYTIDSNDTSNTHGVYLTGSQTRNNTVKNCYISDFYNGFYMFDVFNNTFVNNTVKSLTYDGFNLPWAENNTYINNTVSGCNNHGFCLWYGSYMRYNKFINNNVSGCPAGFWIDSDSNNNLFIDNIVYGNTNGFELRTTNNNNITGGSIWDNTYDYYLRNDAGTTNNFTETNFTASRTIYFQNESAWFNYRNDRSNNIWLKTNVSTTSTITRELTSWSQILMKWNDTNSSGSDITARYNITGLLPNTYYNIYNDSILVDALPTDAYGNLQSFTIDLNGEHEIKVQESEPPKYFNNSTNNTVAGQPTLFSLNWTDNVGLSGHIFSTNNTGTWANDTWTSFWTTIFEDGYETGDMSKWGGADAGTVEVKNISDVVFRGNYGANCTTKGGGWTGAGTSNVGDGKIVYFGHMIKIPNLPSDYIQSFCYSTGSAGTYSATLQNDGDGTWSWIFDGTTVDANPVAEDWFSIEIAVDVVHGWVALWVGGELLVNNTKSLSGTIGTCYMGHAHYASNEEYYTVYYDETKISDTFIDYDDKTMAYSKATKTLNSTGGQGVGWRVYANDTSNNWNTSQIFTLTTVEYEPPKYWNASVSSNFSGQKVQFFLTWTDNGALSGYIFSFDNGTGTLSNDSWVSFGGGSSKRMAVTKFVNATLGTLIRWRVYANDTSGNWNASEIYNFTTENSTFEVDTGMARYVFDKYGFYVRHLHVNNSGFNLVRYVPENSYPDIYNGIGGSWFESPNDSDYGTSNYWRIDESTKNDQDDDFPLIINYSIDNTSLYTHIHLFSYAVTRNQNSPGQWGHNSSPEFMMEYDIWVYQKRPEMWVHTKMIGTNETDVNVYTWHERANMNSSYSTNFVGTAYPYSNEKTAYQYVNATGNPYYDQGIGLGVIDSYAEWNSGDGESNSADVGYDCWDGCGLTIELVDNSPATNMLSKGEIWQMAYVMIPFYNRSNPEWGFVAYYNELNNSANISSVSEGSYEGYDGRFGRYNFTADNNKLTFTLNTSGYDRHYPVFRINEYTSNIVTVTADEDSWTEGVDYLLHRNNETNVLFLLVNKTITEETVFEINDTNITQDLQQPPTTTTTIPVLYAPIDSVIKSQEKVKKIFQSIIPALPKSINPGELEHTNTDITNIYIDVNIRVTKVNVSVQKRYTAPEMSLIPGIVYRYIDITTENLASQNLKAVKIYFKVEKLWLADNSIESSAVTLYKHTYNGWVKVETSRLGEDEYYVYYESIASGFSYFAIVGQTAAEATTTTLPPTTTTTRPIETTTTTTTQPTRQPSVLGGWKIIAIVVIVITSAVIILIKLKNKK